MGTNCSNYRRVCVFFVFGVCGVVAQNAIKPACTADDKCHFGSCVKKEYAYGNVTHNVSTISCKHPFVKAVLQYSEIAQENFPTTQLIAKRCGALPRVRPCCETRRPKTELDTILIVLVSVVAVYSTFSEFELSNKPKKL